MIGPHEDGRHLFRDGLPPWLDISVNRRFGAWKGADADADAYSHSHARLWPTREDTSTRSSWLDCMLILDMRAIQPVHEGCGLVRMDPFQSAR